MIAIDNVLIDEDVLDSAFACELTSCKGACCIEGESGAPLDPNEIGLLEENIHKIFDFITEEGRKTIENKGVYEKDADGEYVTPLINKGPCAYVTYENGIALCGIEKAFQKGAISFQKPISCHLYPVRIQKLSYGERLRYHRWSICSQACIKGRKENIKIYQFVKPALLRRYGKEWYEKLEFFLENFKK
ncbi:MAG: hypothetical protein KatS3mg034_2113 [Vicingaceae bacterium]|nr:MAG: hypothetical protein KatS3mg034_2113 [Vicingaceae bacterium]